jgi:hypothetical protein
MPTGGAGAANVYGTMARLWVTPAFYYVMFGTVAAIFVPELAFFWCVAARMAVAIPLAICSPFDICASVLCFNSENAGGAASTIGSHITLFRRRVAS